MLFHRSAPAYWRETIYSREQAMSLFQPGQYWSQVGTAMVCAILAISTFAPAHARHKPEESAPAITEPSPSSPRLSVPEYQSPLSAFKPYQENDSPGWKELNDRVGELGGWRYYAREAFESEKMEKDSK